MRFGLLSPSQIISISRCENLSVCLQSFYNLILIIFLALDFLYFLFGAIKYLLETSPINISPGGRRGKDMMKSALIGLIILFIFPSILQLVNPEIFQENELVIPVVKVVMSERYIDLEPGVDEEDLPVSQQSIGTRIRVFIGNIIDAIKAAFTGNLDISGLDASTFTKNFNKDTDLVQLEQVKNKPFTVKASSPLAKKSIELSGIVLSRKQMEIHYVLLIPLQRAGAKALENGYVLYITSAYRTPEEQERFYNRNKQAAKQGLIAKHSSHSFGLAIDVNIGIIQYRTTKTGEKKPFGYKIVRGQTFLDNKKKMTDLNMELEKIMCKTGNFVRYHKESWHFEYGTKNWYRLEGSGRCVF